MLVNADQIVHYFMEYGYWFLFIGLLFEGEIVLLTASLGAYMLGYSMPLFLLIAISATLLGNHIWYFLGRLMRGDFVDKYGKYIFLPPMRYKYLQTYISDHGDKTLFFSKFMYGTGRVTILASAVLGMNYQRFLKVDFLASLAWVLFNVSVSFLLAYKFDLSIHNIFYSIKIMAVLVFSLFLLQFLSRYLYFKYLKKKVS